MIANNFTGSPQVINKWVQERESSPANHHLIRIKQRPLEAISLQQRTMSNREVSKKMAIALRAIPRRSNLSKDFKNMTDDLIAQRSVEGVDKSIGEDTDRSSQGSYETKRKYYILNIDNTANEEAPVVSFDSKVDQQSSSLP